MWYVGTLPVQFTNGVDGTRNLYGLDFSKIFSGMVSIKMSFCLPVDLNKRNQYSTENSLWWRLDEQVLDFFLLSLNDLLNRQWTKTSGPTFQRTTAVQFRFQFDEYRNRYEMNVRSSCTGSFEILSNIFTFGRSAPEIKLRRWNWRQQFHVLF